MIGGHRANNHHFGKHEVVVITEMCGYRPNNHHFGKHEVVVIGAISRNHHDVGDPRSDGDYI